MLMIDEFFGSGFLRRSDKVGGSVARASAANVSWIRLIQRSGTTARTDCPSELASEVTNAITTAPMVTVN